MSLPANIRVNVRAPFPTQVASTSFITVSKANGIWTIAPNYLNLAENPGLTATQVFALQDTVTGLWSYMSAQLLIASALSNYRTVTTVGVVNFLATDTILLLKKSSSGASTVNLPLAASRGGVPVTVKDLTGDANTNNITLVPAGSDTIDGFSAAAAAANGVAVIDVDYAWKTLYPMTSGGWYIR